jgi:hypothetical protein
MHPSRPETLPGWTRQDAGPQAGAAPPREQTKPGLAGLPIDQVSRIEFRCSLRTWQDRRYRRLARFI